MRIVLLGKNGQVGWELSQSLKALGDVISLGRADLDLTLPKSIASSLADLRPDVLINASAYTEVDRAETEIKLANNVNAVAPGIMAEVARKRGAIFIHYSTDYVFDGTKNAPYVESDLPNPLNVYGKSKLEGEINIQQASDAYLILRTSWVYSLRGNSFVNKVLQWSRNNTTLKIVQDQISNPTWARMLAEATISALIENRLGLLERIKEIRGIYHLAGSGFTSRYEWAKHILAIDPNRTEQMVQSIGPALSQEFQTPARRPLFSALDCSKFEQIFGLHPPNWKESLREAMTNTPNASFE